jgi:hypothetical protein
VTNEELKNQVPLHLIPESLGGVLKHNHQQWLSECDKLISNPASTSSSYYHFSDKFKESQVSNKRKLPPEESEEPSILPITEEL